MAEANRRGSADDARPLGDRCVRGAGAGRKQYQFSERNLKKVAKAYDLLRVEGSDAEKDEAQAEARKILESINLDRAKPYDRARIHQTLGQLDITAENYEAGARALRSGRLGGRA